uniref:Uncharacterized protein n=1 Tax=Wuchereria bancrofti TaxID=6293 RepID=A0AAF5PQT7_WUCBA
MQINMQELPQKMEKTFANTQFDLNRNLLFDDYARITTESSGLPQQKTQSLIKQDNPISQVSIAKPLPQIPSRLLSSSFTATLPSLLLLSSSSTPSPSVPVVAPSIALGNTESRSRVPTRQTSSNLLWFNDTLPPFDCSHDFQQIAMEFQRKFPAQTARDIREKRLAEMIKRKLIDCDHKTKKNHWQNMVELLAKAKISPSEEEECSNGLVQERIACLNLLSYTCQFIKRDYTFRLIPARVIIQEARIIEDGVTKCVKVIRLIKKHNQPRKF